jgi:hypothetical protein
MAAVIGGSLFGSPINDYPTGLGPLQATDATLDEIASGASKLPVVTVPDILRHSTG